VYKRQPNVFRWIHVSHLGDEHKNISGLIRGFSEALKTNNEMELHIYGDGEIRPYIKQAAEMGLSEQHLKIRGEQPLEQIANAMSAAHALVLFSNYENLPCVIVEAFSCGIPVLSTSVGGIDEIVNKNTGRLIQKGREEELSQALLKMSKEYAIFDPETIRKFAESNFSIESISNQYDMIYEKALREI